MTRRLLLHLVLALAATVTLSCGGAKTNSNSLDYSKRLVHDAKTGQYIGVLMGECKVFDRKIGKETVTYRVERSDGTTIDLPSDKVTLTEQ
jgi:hypothetical protein